MGVHKDDAGFVAAATFVLILFGAFWGFLFGRAVTIDSFRDSAAKAGAGHYTINPETGETRWEWGPK